MGSVSLFKALWESQGVDLSAWLWVSAWRKGVYAELSLHGPGRVPLSVIRRYPRLSLPAMVAVVYPWMLWSAGRMGVVHDAAKITNSCASRHRALGWFPFVTGLCLLVYHCAVWLDAWYPKVPPSDTKLGSALYDATHMAFATDYQSPFNPASWTLRFHLFGAFLVAALQVMGMRARCYAATTA